MNDLIIIGAGGLGKEVADLINSMNNYKLIGFIDEDLHKQNTFVSGVKVLGNLKTLENYDSINLVIAIANPLARQSILEKINCKNYNFPNIIHPNVLIGSEVTLGIGNIICAHTILSTETSLGDFVIINPQCGIGHESTIKSYTTLYWNVTIGGNVSIGCHCELGTKSSINQQLSICDHTVLGAGAVVVKNIYEVGTYVGIPAKSLNKGN